MLEDRKNWHSTAQSSLLNNSKQVGREKESEMPAGFYLQVQSRSFSLNNIHARSRSRPVALHASMLLNSRAGQHILGRRQGSSVWSTDSDGQCCFLCRADYPDGSFVCGSRHLQRSSGLICDTSTAHWIQPCHIDVPHRALCVNRSYGK